VARREPLHLIARFFDVATAKRLRPSEQVTVSELLAGADEARMFWDQGSADQRHGFEAARYVGERSPDRMDLIRAALLHDVGKRYARLGLVGRSVASVLRVAGRSGSGRIRSYILHGPIAAAELEASGAESLVVDFARHHHGERPEQISESDWEVLGEADKVRR